MAETSHKGGDIDDGNRVTTTSSFNPSCVGQQFLNSYIEEVTIREGAELAHLKDFSLMHPHDLLLRHYALRFIDRQTKDWRGCSYDIFKEAKFRRGYDKRRLGLVLNGLVRDGVLKKVSVGRVQRLNGNDGLGVIYAKE